MPRVKHSPAGKARHKKVLKAAKGNFGARGGRYKIAKLTVEKGMTFAFRDRRAKKRDFRGVWIMRINAAARLHGDMSYSHFIDGLKKKNVKLDRKVLAELAVKSPEVFAQLVQLAKSA